MSTARLHNVSGCGTMRTASLRQGSLVGVERGCSSAARQQVRLALKLLCLQLLLTLVVLKVDVLVFKSLLIVLCRVKVKLHHVLQMGLSLLECELALREGLLESRLAHASKQTIILQ